MKTLEEELNDYIKWCKSQEVELKPQQYSVFKFYMMHVYPYKKEINK